VQVEGQRLPARAHALRATAATNALDHQADIAKVQEWLGHANISTTRIYDHRRTRPEDARRSKSPTDDSALCGGVHKGQTIRNPLSTNCIIGNRQIFNAYAAFSNFASHAGKRGAAACGMCGGETRATLCCYREVLIVIDHRAETITSFPLGKPVFSRATTAGIASDKGTMRPIVGASLPCSAASAMPARACSVGFPNTR
jgi:hypothetical protein